MVFDFSRPLVMGILNVTPDSFSDGGRFTEFDSALARVEQMILQGADIIDVGGESTRPGAAEVNCDDEIQRVVPLIEAITDRFDTPVSVDTSKAAVMRAAVSAGAAMINDVRALQEEGALDVVVESQLPVCLMHMQGQPRSMQHSPSYQDVVKEVYSFLAQRVDVCVSAGVKRDNIIVDPGFGFGKTLDHNLSLLKHLADFNRIGLPTMVGVSRKSMFGTLLGREVSERLPASLAAALLALQSGAAILRVHDVVETVDVVKVFQAASSAE